MEEQENKGLASATFSRGEKMETFISNPCRFRRELEGTMKRFFHFEIMICRLHFSPEGRARSRRFFRIVDIYPKLYDTADQREEMHVGDKGVLHFFLRMTPFSRLTLYILC